MIHTTGRKAIEEGACEPSYSEMGEALGGVDSYGDNTPIPLSKVLEVCGLEDAIWCLRIAVEPIDKEARLFACDCAERVISIFEREYPNDNKPRNAIEVARKFANGEATHEELKVAWTTARLAASSAARSTTMASSAARSAVEAAARSAVEAALKSAAWAWDAVGAGEEEWQQKRFLQLLNNESKE